MNTSLNTFVGLDQEDTPEEHLQKIDANVIFTMGYQPLDPVAYNQKHKKLPYIQWSLS